MFISDSLLVLKKLATDEVPYINTGVFLGMTALDWDLALKVVLGLASIAWTFVKVYLEWKKAADAKCAPKPEPEAEDTVRKTKK